MVFNMKTYSGENIIIMACSNCNIRCEHCYIGYKGNINTEELLSIVSHLKVKYNVNINGAELLTNIEYLKSLQEVKQSFFMSNGLIIYNNPEILEEIKKYGIKSISISYHFGIHDSISKVPEKVIPDIISLIKAHGLQVRLLITISSLNYFKIEEMCEISKKHGVRGIKFTNYLMQGNAKNLDEHLVLTEDQKEYFFKKIRYVREKYDIDDLLIERCGTFGKDTQNNKCNFYCDSCVNSVVIAPNNNVYPCVFLATEGFEIGHYKNGEVLINDFYKESNVCIADQVCNKNNVNVLRRIK